MKKLISILLLLALLIAPVSAVAELSSEEARTAIYQMIETGLSGIGMTYDAMDEYKTIMFYNLVDGSQYGDALFTTFTHDDGFIINCIYEEPFSTERLPEVLVLCNLINSDLSRGKLMAEYYNDSWYLSYEVFCDVNPENITDWDQNNYFSYCITGVDMLETMSDYLKEIENGTEGRYVYAMWQTDMGLAD